MIELRVADGTGRKRKQAHHRQNHGGDDRDVETVVDERLNEARNVCALAGLKRSVVRGENTAPSIDVNLSIRPPAIQRNRSLMKISSWRYAPPSFLSSPFGAREILNSLCR